MVNCICNSETCRRYDGAWRSSRGRNQRRLGQCMWLYVHWCWGWCCLSPARLQV